MPSPIIPSMIVPRSTGAISAQNITYNQAGLTYNDNTTTYGGFYGYADIRPLISLSLSVTPHLSVSRSQASLLDQSLVYNQSGVSYNDSRYSYGGIYGFSDASLIPSMVITIDNGPVTPTPPPSGNLISIGPGFFLFITH